MLDSAAGTNRRQSIDVPGTGPAVARSFDRWGRPAAPVNDPGE
jgi:hypothetical protein